MILTSVAVRTPRSPTRWPRTWPWLAATCLALSACSGSGPVATTATMQDAARPAQVGLPPAMPSVDAARESKAAAPPPLVLPSMPPAAAVAPAPAPVPASAPAVRMEMMAKPMLSHAQMPVLPPQVTDTARYQAFADNPWKRVAQEPVSTFSIDVDTGSYANVRRFLNRGQLPPADAVRVEEMVNYFGYRYPLPAADAPHPFGVGVQLAASPWGQGRGLMRVAIQGKDVAKTTLPPANLVFLVDVSGSMSPADRLPLVKSALRLLAQQLRPVDRVSMVTYASGVRVVLPPTPGDQTTAIQQAIDALVAGGSTAGEAGIRLAYAQARASHIDGGINRVLLATDGDLNVGVNNPDELKKLVEAERKAGTSLTTLGVGDSNYNEVLMKKLADAGDGSYRYLDSLQEAHKVLVHQFTSTLAVIAQDVKLQIEFNPALVDEYRLLGYELRTLTREQFNNDQVDAGDVGAGHSVTALYEVVPRGGKGSVDPLRYQKEGGAAPPSGAHAQDRAHASELAWLKLRYKQPGQTASTLVEFPVHRAAGAWPALAQADEEFRFAAAIAGWGQWLRGSTLIGDAGPAQFLPLARGARGEDRHGHRAESLRLMELSASLRR